MFTSDDIKARIKQQPFVPVRFLTTTGDAYDVYHPDLVMVGRRIVFVGTAIPDDPATFDQVVRLAILHIAAMQDLTVPTPPKQNGSAPY